VADRITIIENGLTVTCDRQNRIGNYSILVRGDYITELAHSSSAWKDVYPHAQIVDATDKIVVPGFIEPFFNTPEYLLRAESGANPFGTSQSNPRIAKAHEFLDSLDSAEDYQRMYEVAFFAALKSGVTTICDISTIRSVNALKGAIQALKRSDVRGVVGINNNEGVSISASSSKVTFVVVLPGEDELTVYSLQTSIRLAKEFNLPVCISLGRSKESHDLLKRNFSFTLTKLLRDYKFFDTSIFLAGSVVFERNDTSILATAGVPIVLTPRSVDHTWSEYPPYRKLLNDNSLLALSSDLVSPEPLTNIRVFSQHVSEEGINLTSGSFLIRLHTIHAARALGLDSVTGSIEPGKQADIAMIDISDFRFRTLCDSGDRDQDLGAILKETHPHNVTDVMIRGDFFLRERTLLTMSEDELIFKAKVLKSTLLPPLEHEIPAQVLPLTPTSPQMATAVNTPQAEISEDEGFRVIKQKGTPPGGTDSPSRTITLPPNVRKSFGDEDVENI